MRAFSNELAPQCWASLSPWQTFKDSSSAYSKTNNDSPPAGLRTLSDEQVLHDPGNAVLVDYSPFWIALASQDGSRFGGTTAYPDASRTCRGLDELRR